MDKGEYENIQELLISQGRIFALLDLEGFLSAIEHSDAVGPLFQPTLWMAAHDRMEIIRTLAKGAQFFKSAVHRAEKMRAELHAKEVARDVRVAKTREGESEG